MAIFTSQQLIDRAVAAADMHDNFVTPAQWYAWLGLEAYSLDLFLARLGMPNLSGLVAVLNNEAPGFIKLTQDPVTIAGVWEIRNGRYRPVRYRPIADFAHPIDPSLETNIPTGAASAWSIKRFGAPSTVPPATAEGSGVASAIVNIVLSPPPPATDLSKYVAMVLYPQGSATVDQSSQFAYSMGAEERIVLRLARRALLKENSDVSDIDRQIREVEGEIEEWADSVAAQGAYAVRNVDNVQRGWIKSEDLNPWSPFYRESWWWG